MKVQLSQYGKRYRAPWMHSWTGEVVGEEGVWKRVKWEVKGIDTDRHTSLCTVGDLKKAEYWTEHEDFLEIVV